MADEFPYALFVEGKWDPKTPKLKNKLTIYFQSKKSSGGDCCVELLEAQKATVSFKTEKVRRNVLGKQTHKIKLGQNLVSLNVYLSPEAAQESQSPVRADQTAFRSQEEPPAKDEKPRAAEPQTEEAEDQESGEKSEVSAVLENIQDMSQDILVMLVENVLKEGCESKDFSIEIIPESNCAVVTFTNRKVAETFITSCPGHSIFRKNNLDVRPLEKTTKVKAEDLPSNLNPDYIFLYFEKFGEIEGDVEMLEDGQSAIITFQVHTALNTVLSIQHQIKYHSIKVLPYYESLGTALYGKDRPTLRLPETFTEKINKSVWKYLHDNPGSLDLIKQEIRKHFCQLDLQDADVKISPLASLLHQGLQTRQLIQTWREKASAEFTAAMSKYKSLEIIAQRDAWNKMEAEIRKTLLTEPVTMVLQKDRGTVILAGLAEDVGRTGDVVQNIVNRVTQIIQREKGSVTDEIIMDPSIYEIVMLDGLEQEITNSFPEMELSYHSHSKKLALYGLKQEVLESKNKILQEVIGLKRRMVELHPSILEYFTRREQQELTSDLFLSKGFRASLEIKENQASLVAKTEKTLKDSEEHLKAVLIHKCLDVEDPSVFRKAEWQDLITRLNNSFNSPVMTVVINTSGSQVMVAGFGDVVELVLEQLSDFVQNNSNLVATTEADNIVVKFIQEHKKPDWIENVKNKVSIDFKDGKILLSGPRVHVSQCKPVFQNLVSSVHHCNLKVTKPGAKKFFKVKESMYVIAAKDQTGCLVELVDEHEFFQAGAVSVGKQGALTPGGVEIVVSKGNQGTKAGGFMNGDSFLKKIHLVENNSASQVSRNEPSHHQQNLNLDVTNKFNKRINIQSSTPGAITQQQNKAYAKSWITKSRDKDDQQQMGKGFVIKGKVVNPACFSICGPSKAAVDQAKQWIEKLISDEQAFESITDPVILSLSDKDQQRILELQQSMDVSVRVEHKVQVGDQEKATILVEGLSRDVLMAVSEIQTILKKAREEAGLKKDMKVTSELVDWQYQQGGQYQSFDQLTNLYLEQALAKKSPHVDITLHRQSYKVTMPEGPAVSAVGGNQINVRRIDKTQATTTATECFPLSHLAFSEGIKGKIDRKLISILIHNMEITTTSTYDSNKGTTVPEIKYSKHLSGGLTISVWKDDLTTHKADAVVNAANEYLNHGGGLVEALCQAGGPQIQQQSDNIIKVQGLVPTGEAVVTPAGNLPCKYIIHAVGPHMPPNPSMKDIATASPLLDKSIRSIFQCTEYHNLQSVAIPAISSGLLNFPRQICADIIVGAVRSFSNMRNPQRVNLEVRLVNNDDPSVQEMLRACKEILGPSDKVPSPYGPV